MSRESSKTRGRSRAELEPVVGATFSSGLQPRKMISKSSETTIYLEPIDGTDLKPPAKESKRQLPSLNTTKNYHSTGRNINILRNSLVNYLRLVSLYSCYDMLTPYTLIAFVLVFNCFISAQHHDSNNNQQSSRGVRGLGSANNRLYWNWTSQSQNQPSEKLTMPTARARRNVVGPTATGRSTFDANDGQIVQEVYDDNQQEGSKPAPSFAALETVTADYSDAGQHYEILRIDAPKSSPRIENGAKLGLDKVSPTTSVPTRDSNRSWSAGGAKPQSNRSFKNRNQSGSQPQLTPEFSFRQAQPDEARSTVAAPNSGTSVVKTTTSGLPNAQSRTSQRPTSNSARSQLAIDESHWIPITRTQHRDDLLKAPSAVMAQPTNPAAMALLDYPPAHGQRLSPPSTLLQQLDSFSYGQRNTPLINSRRPHTSYGYSYAPQHEAPNHFHHESRHHNHHYSNHYDNYHHNHYHNNRHNHHWPHRRPRFQNELSDNEIGLPPPPPMRPAGKMYKRVLLCDKTLVSLDYIRNVNFEPMPDRSGSDHLLDEHEINEISDSFLDLENHLEVQMSRLKPILANTSDELIENSRRSNITTRLSGNGNETITASDSSDQLTAQASGSSRLERRSGAWQLLSDEDPLVRCDMWDLEKGLKSRKPPKEILRMAIKADFDTVRDAINRCRQLSERTLPPDDEFRGDGLEMIMSTEDLISFFSVKRGLIPGTKWCGLGDQADSYNDLGPKHRIDICCRAHDHCPIRSKPFRNDYGILNIGLYTKSHCDCDADFYRCLREVRSRTADMLGNLYFNVMKLQCMREERLKVCREAKPIALGFERCVRYEDSPTKTVFKFTTPPVAF